MAHTQKPDFVFQRNGRVHFNRQGASVQSTTGSRGVRISSSNAGYTMFRSRVKGTGYPLHSPVSSSLPLPCVNVCHHISTGLYTELRIRFVPLLPKLLFLYSCYCRFCGLVSTGLFISPSGISKFDCATTKTDTAERSISIGRESLQVFFVLGAVAYFQVPPLGGSREEKWRSQ